MTKNSNNRENILGLIACYFLAILCLCGGVSQTYKLRSLLNEGRRADAEVSGLHVGAKGLKTAVLTFMTDGGETVSTRDMFPMMLRRFKKGDHVTVLYKPTDVKLVTIDLGYWMWQQPVIFFFGFVLLSALSVVLPKMKRVNNKN